MTEHEHYMAKRDISENITVAGNKPLAMTTAVLIFTGELDKDPTLHCSGTLLSEDIIITAATCFDADVDNVDDFTIVAGDLEAYLAGQPNTAEKIGVKRVRIHPHYEHVPGVQPVWNLAIVHLRSKLNLQTNTNMEAAMLPPPGMKHTGKLVQLCGLETAPDGSVYLVEKEVIFGPDKHCQDELEKGKFSTEKDCGGKKGSNNCEKITGSGIIYRGWEKPIVLGILSLGSTVCQNVAVLNILPWIFRETRLRPSYEVYDDDSFFKEFLQDVTLQTSLCSNGCDEDLKTNATADFTKEEFPLMFLGPGYGSNGISNGISEVFSFPNQSSGLASSTCTVPTHPLTDVYNSVGFVHEGYLQICGGEVAMWKGGGYHASCYQLKDSAWVTTSPLMVARATATSVRLQDGSILVSGGVSGGPYYLQSSEMLTASATWSAAIELPSGRAGHCMLLLTTGQLFLHGGYTSSGPVGDTYISEDMRTWVKMTSSPKPMHYHACVEHAGSIWLGGGYYDWNYKGDGYKDGTTEKYQLSTDSWTNGPDLPTYTCPPGEFISHGGMLTYAGGSNNKNIYQLNTKQNGWIKIGEMTQNRAWFPALTISENICKGVKQVKPPSSDRE